MTIPSNDDVEQGIHESNDPFSKLSMEWNMENEKVLYETATSTVLQDEMMTTAFDAARESSLEDHERDSDCPLLQKVSIDHLPPPDSKDC